MLQSIDYKKTDLTELHSALLDVLKQFIRFCEEYNLQYYAYGGTLLGAIRHSGFIPWDDDIDIGMKREDYNRLLEIISSDAENGLNNDKYKFVNAENDPYFNKGFTRLTNCETTEISIKDAPFKYNRGCFIDIIPMDYIPDMALRKRIFIFKCNLFINLIRMCSRYTNRLNLKNWGISKKVLYYFSFPLFVTQIITTSKLHKNFQRYLTKQAKSSKLCNSTIVPGNSRWMFDEKWFHKTIKVPFEDINICVPEMYDKVLTNLYGDYMTPVVEAPTHGDTIFEVSIPYKQFLRDHYEELLKLWENRK